MRASIAPCGLFAHSRFACSISRFRGTRGAIERACNERERAANKSCRRQTFILCVRRGRLPRVKPISGRSIPAPSASTLNSSPISAGDSSFCACAASGA